MNETKKNIEYTLPASFYNDSDNLGNLFEVYFMKQRIKIRQLMGGNDGIHKIMDVVAE
jgi:deoxyadenosine/deoxycytidine kinase